jgi:hypothetical protein
MKKVFKVLLLVLVVSAGTITTNEVKSQSVNVSFSVFQNSLRPYGRWVNHRNYGQVWISNQRDFRPYQTGGHWAYTDYGWTWVSDYNWGWAPFHYGRWSYERSLGWYWVPGYEWAPAWVAWRSGGDVYGWAPLSPGLNIGIDISFGNQIPYDRWVFAPHRYITSPYVSRHFVSRSRNTVYMKNTTIINNVTVKNNVHFVAGPRKEDVERVNHTKIRTLTVANSSKPGKTVVNKNTVNVYRPVINDNDKTVINKNSNNTTVNKNSNNTNVADDNTKNSTTDKTTEKKKDVVKKEAKKPAVKKAVAENTDVSDKTVDKASKHPAAAKNTAERKIAKDKKIAAQKAKEAKRAEEQKEKNPPPQK